jgi:sugar-specific transcriptional regulator TrmB
MKQIIAPVFYLLGLREEHARVYLALLEHPHIPASRIAHYAHISRTHSYALILDLIAHALVEEIETEHIRRYRACDPVLLISKIKEHEDRAHTEREKLLGAMPQLCALQPKSPWQPRIKFYQGAEGLKDLYNIMLTCTTKKIYGCGDFATVFPAKRDPSLNRWLWNYGKRRAKKGIWYYGILNRSSASDLAHARRSSEKRVLKVLEGISLAAEFCIFDNSIAICSTSDEMVGVLIESEAIASSARALHQSVWCMLPEYGCAGQRREHEK